MYRDVLEIIDRVKHLLIPGPIEPVSDVMKVAGLKLIGHFSEEFAEIYHGIEDMFKRIIYAGKENEVVLIPGSSILGLESIFANIIEPHTKVLIISCGFFGKWMSELASIYSDNVDVIEKPFGKAPNEDEVIDRVKEADYDIVGLVHCETSAGLTIRFLDKIGRAVREKDSLLIIDGVSSVGAEKLLFDEWGVDAVVTGPQKALGALPGVSIVAMSKRLVDRIYNRPSGKRVPFYMDLIKHIKIKYEYGRTLTTPPVNNVMALYESLRRIIDYGVDRYIDMHRDRAEKIYKYAIEKGLDLLVGDERYRSYSVCALKINNSLKIIKELKERHGIVVGSGLGEYRNKLIRIGMMGFTPTNIIMKAIDLIASLVKE